MKQEYQLECPACLARFHLKKHVPEKRIRCRKCRKVMIIPPLPGVVVEKVRHALAPERKEVVTRPLRLRALSLAAPLILLAVGATTFLLMEQVEIRLEEDSTREKKGPMTFDRLLEENQRSPFPLAIGLGWIYAGEGEVSEERHVISSYPSQDSEPQFEYTLTDPVGSTRMLLRATNEGILLLEEKTITGDQISYDPPLLVVPSPLYMESKWEYNGSVSRGTQVEKWDLTFAVENAESVITPVGTFSCLRVLSSGFRGKTPVEETVWYSLGTGPVQIRKRIGERMTTFTLQELNRP